MALLAYLPADASSTPITPAAIGLVEFAAIGTWDSATVVVEQLLTGSTYVTLASFTANARTAVQLYHLGVLRATMTNDGAATDVNVYYFGPAASVAVVNST
jgi:hypothetical protein